MVTTDLVKKFMYVPAEVEEDDVIIGMFINVATAYVKNACDYFSEYYEGGEFENRDFIAQADMAILLYVSELYQNRDLYNSQNVDPKPPYMVTSLYLQLQTYPNPYLCKKCGMDTRDKKHDLLCKELEQ